MRYGGDILHSYSIGEKYRKQMKQKIVHYYNWSQNKPIIEAMIIDFIAQQLEYSVLGKDLANIILSFLDTAKYNDPANEHYSWICRTCGRYYDIKEIKPSNKEIDHEALPNVFSVS